VFAPGIHAEQWRSSVFPANSTHASIVAARVGSVATGYRVAEREPEVATEEAATGREKSASECGKGKIDEKTRSSRALCAMD
jgi:hypothetical protein